MPTPTTGKGIPFLGAIRTAWVKWSTFLFGIYAVNSMSVTTMIWGNLSVYTSSYFYCRVNNPGPVQAPWPSSLYFMAWAPGMILTKSLLLYYVGSKRLVSAIGIALAHGGMILSYLTVQHSVLALSLTLGIMVGLGSGICSAIILVSIVEWTETCVGLTTAGFVVSAGVGGVISNQIMTRYINPDNLRTDQTNGKISYFSQPELIDRVPSFFLLLGTVSLCINAFGLFFLRTKDSGTGAESNALVNESKVIMTSPKERCACRKTEYHSIDIKTIKKPCQKTQSSHIKASVETTLGSSRTKVDGRNGFVTGDYAPREMLKTYPFYALALAIMFSDLSYLTISSYYKTFGVIYIPDDQFLTDVGSFLNISFAVFSVMSGIIIDHVSLKTTAVCSTILLTFVSAFYYFTPMFDKWPFAISTVVFSGLIYFNYNIFMVAGLKMFGQTHYSTNYGLSLVPGVIMVGVAPPIVAGLVETWGWFYLFFTIALINAITVALIQICFPKV